MLVCYPCIMVAVHLVFIYSFFFISIVNFLVNVILSCVVITFTARGVRDIEWAVCL